MSNVSTHFLGSDFHDACLRRDKRGGNCCLMNCAREKLMEVRLLVSSVSSLRRRIQFFSVTVTSFAGKLHCADEHTFIAESDLPVCILSSFVLFI